MISSRSLFGLFSVLALGLGLTACEADATVSAGPGPGPVTGTTTGYYQLLWTIDGSTSPAACAAIGADQMIVTVYDSTGNASNPVAAPCENFNVQLELLPDLYDADAQLVDFNGVPVTDVLQLNNLRVTSGTTLTSDADF